MDATEDTQLRAPLIYTDLATLRRERPNFDPDCVVTIDDFAALISATLMREKLTCQLHTQHGGRCNQPHRKGWLAARKDGREGLIGGDCADIYFKASETFRTERKRMHYEMAVEDHLSVLRELLKDRLAVGARIRRCRERLRAYRGAVNELAQRLPSPVISQLRGFAKSGNRIRVSVEVQYVVDVDEKGNEKKSWEPREVGSIIGLSVWDNSHLTDISRDLEAADLAQQNAILDKGQRLRDLKAWRESLGNQLPLCEQDIERLHRSLEDFTAAANLSMLCHLVRNQEEQRQIAGLVLERGGENASPVRIQAALNQIYKQVRSQFGGRDFRVGYG